MRNWSEAGPAPGGAAKIPAEALDRFRGCLLGLAIGDAVHIALLDKEVDALQPDKKEDDRKTAQTIIGLTDDLTAGGRLEVSRNLISGGPRVTKRTRAGDFDLAVVAEIEEGGRFQSSLMIIGHGVPS